MSMKQGALQGQRDTGFVQRVGSSRKHAFQNGHLDLHGRPEGATFPLLVTSHITNMLRLWGTWIGRWSNHKFPSYRLHIMCRTLPLLLPIPSPQTQAPSHNPRSNSPSLSQCISNLSMPSPAVPLPSSNTPPLCTLSPTIPTKPLQCSAALLLSQCSAQRALTAPWATP